MHEHAFTKIIKRIVLPLMFAVIIAVVIDSCRIYNRYKRIRVIKDYDPKLTLIAKAAIPLINQILSYKEIQSDYPSPTILRELVRDPRMVNQNESELSNSFTKLLDITSECHTNTFWHCLKGVAKKLGDLIAFALRLMFGSLTLANLKRMPLCSLLFIESFRSPFEEPHPLRRFVAENPGRSIAPIRTPPHTFS